MGDLVREMENGVFDMGVLRFLGYSKAKQQTYCLLLQEPVVRLAIHVE